MSSRVGILSICALVAVVLQIILAPNIAIMGTMPHFIIAFAVAVSLVLAGESVYVMVFCLGILADLFGYGPVGALSFILLLNAMVVSLANKTFGNGTLFVSCIIVVASTLLVHFLHAAFMVAMTSTYTVLEAFSLIAIPQSLYDCVLAVVCYIALRRLAEPADSSRIPTIAPRLR